MRLRSRALATPGHVLTGLAAEATYTTDVVLRWARGFGPERVAGPTVDRLRTTVLPTTPVMLVHGLGANKSYFTKLARRLTAAGYTVFSVNYPWARADLASCGAHVADDARRLLAETGAASIHVVAHSLGGVVLRWALTHTDLRDKVHVAVTLGSPHDGAPLAALVRRAPLLGDLLHQLEPGSADLADLVGPAQTPGTRWVAVGGALDWIVPGRRALLPAGANVRNVLLPAGTHIALAAHPDTVAIVLKELTAAEHPARTSAAGTRVA